MIKISYLIALYNKEKYIIDAIDSILEDISMNYDLQICVVDDGSTDNSLKIISKKYKEDHRVIIDSFKKNMGKVAAYNRAFEMSSGNYLALLGADDKVLVGRTSAMLEKLLNVNKSVYGGLIKHVEETGSETLLLPNKRIDFRENILENKFSGGTLLMRRLDCGDIFPMPEALRFEDWWISFHLLRINSVCILNEPVTFYRIHSSNDCGVDKISFESMKKDFGRHLECLEMFTPYIKNRIDKVYLRRAISLRKCFFGEKDFSGLINRPFDQSWMKLLSFNFIGARATLFLHVIRNKFTRR